jgi:hypothetical protein
MAFSCSLVMRFLGLAFSEGPPPSSHRDLFKVDTFPGTLATVCPRGCCALVTVLLGLKTSDSEPEELSSSSLCDLSGSLGFSVHSTGYFKKEKKEKESKRGRISQRFTFINSPQVVVAFAKKSPAR